MPEKKINRFNVYARYEPARKQERFWLEALADGEWSSVCSEGNHLEYRNLRDVACKIVSLLPAEYEYTRVISKNKPQEDTAALEGITLHRTGPVVLRELSLEERKELADLLYELTRKITIHSP
jgi:hypothetical protein